MCFTQDTDCSHISGLYSTGQTAHTLVAYIARKCHACKKMVREEKRLGINTEENVMVVNVVWGTYLNASPFSSKDDLNKSLLREQPFWLGGHPFFQSIHSAK